MSLQIQAKEAGHKVMFALEEIARMIERSNSEEEADELWKSFNQGWSFNLPWGIDFDYVWDYFVDWEKVKWAKDNELKEEISRKVKARGESGHQNLRGEIKLSKDLEIKPIPQPCKNCKNAEEAANEEYCWFMNNCLPIEYNSSITVCFYAPKWQKAALTKRLCDGLRDDKINMMNSIKAKVLQKEKN